MNGISIAVYVIVFALVLAITCWFSFSKQFDRLDSKIELEYRGILPFLQKRAELFNRFIKTDFSRLLQGDEDQDSFGDDLQRMLSQLSKDHDRNDVIANNAVLAALLPDVYALLSDSEEHLDAEQKKLYDELIKIEEDINIHAEVLNKAIRTYNVMISMFPGSIMAKLLKRKEVTQLKIVKL